ncbi:nucleolar transcription factor 1-B-like [Gambusia affinis]|uniref:nucleolar transcription factor 1-B-like n=1 Tax=Gambusia affinis TaxID=33528 RepID=UPI001CDD8A94|nr:nucleolar transcription factor 1-B-like [Gambusia affinis]
MDGAESATTWTTADLLKLVGRIRRNTPESEKRSSYQVGLLSVNWDKTAFRPYSAKECHDMWQKVMKKMRKCRSLPDLIAEAEEGVSKPLLHRRREYEKRHVLGCVKPWRKFDNVCEDNNLHCTRKSRKAKLSVIDGLPVKPPLDSLSLLIEENAAEKPSLGSAFFSEMKKRWRKLDAAEKDEYYTRCLKMKHEYNDKLKEYLDRFDETEKQRFIKEQDIRFLKVKPLRTSPCEPKMPSQSIFTYLARDKRMSSAKSKNLLHKLPVKEKERYKEQMRSDMERYSENLRKWFKKLTPEEQTKYLIQKPNKLQFLDAKKKQVCDREELNLSQPSDSEDEDIMEISSEDDIWSSYEDESGEDWDMFEMHR